MGPRRIDGAAFRHVPFFAGFDLLHYGTRRFGPRTEDWIPARLFVGPHAARKLGAANRTQAVAIALRDRIIGKNHLRQIIVTVLMPNRFQPSIHEFGICDLPQWRQCTAAAKTCRTSRLKVNEPFAMRQLVAAAVNSCLAASQEARLLYLQKLPRQSPLLRTV